MMRRRRCARQRRPARAVVRLDWDGNLLGAIGNGPGRGDGQFVESNDMAMDAQGNLYTGDTSVARITKMVAPPGGAKRE